MSKFPPIPRLSIVVPIGRDLAAFECTLISVLENRPAGCEVIVPHDGSYDDPFELCDEVRFVIADSNNLVDTVAAGASESRGRFVHVLAEGIRATLGWTEAALEKFEHHDTGAVAPTIRQDEDDTILAAGWFDGSDRLCKNVCHGKADVDGQSFSQIGAFLQASFWRRDLLRSLRGAFRLPLSLEASYAYEHLIRRAGWRCELAAECNLLCNLRTLPWDSKSFGRGKRLRAIRNHFRGGGWLRSISAASGAVLANSLHPGLLGESLGQAAAPLDAANIAAQLNASVVIPCEDTTILAMPAKRGRSQRRAA